MDNFTLNTIGVSNFAIDGFNPVNFSILGMLIVFFGLIVISLYIVVLPKLLNISKTLKQKQKDKEQECISAKSDTDQESEQDVLLAIAVAFHLDQDFPEDDQKVTWISHGDLDSSWLATGIAHGLSVRNNVHISRRRH